MEKDIRRAARIESIRKDAAKRGNRNAKLAQDGGDVDNLELPFHIAFLQSIGEWDISPEESAVDHQHEALTALCMSVVHMKPGKCLAVDGGKVDNGTYTHSLGTKVFKVEVRDGYTLITRMQ